MPKNCELSEFQKGLIIGCYLCGKTERQICDITGHSKSTVHYNISKWNYTGTCSNVSRSGRPPKLNVRGLRHVKRVAKANRRSTLTELNSLVCASTSVNVCERTLRSYLHKVGLYGRIAVHKPFISPSNRLKRLSWCKLKSKWSLQQWRSVIWSDEKSFKMFKCGRQIVWREAKEQQHIDCQVPMVKFGGGSIMVWSFFSWYGLGPLVVIDGILNAEKYKHILKTHLLPNLKKLSPFRQAIFQDDNAPCHTAKSVVNWKNQQHLSTLDWVGQSPDLNPIEHLWDVLQRVLHKLKPVPNNKAEFTAALHLAWNSIEQTTYRKLVDSMPRRVASVRANYGYASRY